jgi:hypothetical protein
MRQDYRRAKIDFRPRKNTGPANDVVGKSAVMLKLRQKQMLWGHTCAAIHEEAVETISPSVFALLMPKHSFNITEAVPPRTHMRLHETIVRPDAGLCVYAPILVIADGLHGVIVLRWSELAFPGESWTDIRAGAVETDGMSEHGAWFHFFAPAGCAGGAAIPAASRIARRKAVRAI